MSCHHRKALFRLPGDWSGMGKCISDFMSVWAHAKGNITHSQIYIYHYEQNTAQRPEIIHVGIISGALKEKKE